MPYLKYFQTTVSQSLSPVTYCIISFSSVVIWGKACCSISRLSLNFSTLKIKWTGHNLNCCKLDLKTRKVKLTQDLHLSTTLISFFYTFNHYVPFITLDQRLWFWGIENNVMLRWVYHRPVSCQYKVVYAFFSWNFFFFLLLHILLERIIDRPAAYHKYPAPLLLSYQNCLTHNIKKRCLCCPEWCGVWCVVKASLPSPSMHNNVRLRSAGIHAVTSSVPVSSFLWQELCFTGSLQAKTDCIKIVMT